MNLFVLSIILTAILGVLAISGFVPPIFVLAPFAAYALQLLIVSVYKAWKIGC